MKINHNIKLDELQIEIVLPCKVSLTDKNYVTYKMKAARKRL